MSNKDLLQNLGREACISIKKNRLKLYPNNTVYLKDKQEFEIELFNPSSVTRLARISINGKPISNAGIVLKPGQRVYLERYIDSPEKFRFDTYTVDGNNSSAMNAIANNGDVQIDFYDEYVPMRYSNTGLRSTTVNTSYSDSFDCSATKGAFYGSVTPTSGIIVGASCSANLSNQEGLGELYDEFEEKCRTTLETKEKETGRVEKGSFSEQKFVNYTGSFNTWTSKVVKIKVLPFSEKPLEKQDIANYCTSCGTKNKGGKFKFCPTCGTKF